jgi:hypothetical protein
MANRAVARQVNLHVSGLGLGALHTFFEYDCANMERILTGYFGAEVGARVDRFGRTWTER